MNLVLLQNSLLLALLVAGVATLFGFAAALFAARSSPTVRNCILVGAILAFALPPFLVTNTWLHYLGLTGVWRKFIDFNLYSFAGTALLMTLLFWPLAFGFSLAALGRIPPEQVESDPHLRGAALVRHVLFPLCKQHLFAAFLVTFVLALNHFTVPALLQTKVYPAEVWLRFNTSFDYRQALAVSWPLILAPLLLVFFFRFRPLPLRFQNASVCFTALRKRAGAFSWVTGFITAVLLLLSLLLPLWQLVSSSRTWIEFLPAFAAGSTALWTSAWIAAGSALLALILARFTARLPMLGFSWLLFLAPGVLLAMALIYFFNRAPFSAFYQSLGILFLAYALKFFAPAWSGLRAALATTDPALDDFARLHGTSVWDRFRHIEFPQLRTFLAALFYLLFILVLWDVETLVLLVPPGSETISLRIFNMLHYGHAGQVDALCVWLLLLAIMPIVLFFGAINLYRLGLSKTFPIGLGLLLLGGCGSRPENETAIKSQFFSSVQVFGSRGNGPGQFNKPRSVGVDRQDNFYVVDLTGRVQKFSPDGQFLLSWVMPQTDKGKPKGMTLDPEGRLVLIEPHYCRVNHFDGSGKLALQWGVNGTNSGQLMFPRAVAINSRGEVYLSEYGLVERVQRYSQGGTNFLNSFGRPGTGPGEFNRPEGLGIDSHDRLFVADSCNHRIQVFSAEGTFREQFGKAGTGPGELSYPYDVRVDVLGNRFVCEFGNSRIQVFDEENEPAEIIGKAGAEPGQFNNPWAIALDSRGNLYVADAANHRVQKFIRKGNYPAQLTRTGDSTLAIKK